MSKKLEPKCNPIKLTEKAPEKMLVKGDDPFLLGKGQVTGK